MMVYKHSAEISPFPSLTKKNILAALYLIKSCLLIYEKLFRRAAGRVYTQRALEGHLFRADNFTV